MGIIKKFKDFLSPTSLEEYLLKNTDKYLKEIENLDIKSGDIYITTNESKAFIPQEKYRQEYEWMDNQLDEIFGKENNYKWVYFNDDRKEIYYVNNYKTRILQVKKVDNYKDVSIYITKQVDLKDKEIKEATKKESGYIWENIDNLMFNTFNNDPKWGINVSHYLSSGLIVLETFGFDIKSSIDNNNESDKELKRYVNWIKDQLEIITNLKFKATIDYGYRRIGVNNTQSHFKNSVNVKFQVNYPYL